MVAARTLNANLLARSEVHTHSMMPPLLPLLIVAMSGELIEEQELVEQSLDLIPEVTVSNKILEDSMSSVGKDEGAELVVSQDGKIVANTDYIKLEPTGEGKSTVLIQNQPVAEISTDSQVASDTSELLEGSLEISDLAGVSVLASPHA